jgi:LmbE family N-acetylglucosaminyl deacetylase
LLSSPILTTNRFGPGGTLARYAAEGAAVHIAIATDGAAGSVVSEYEEHRARLAEVRRHELEAAVAVLGAQLHMLRLPRHRLHRRPGKRPPRCLR